MHCLTRDLDTLVTQRVELELKSAGVIGTPVLQESTQPLAGHTSLPPRPEAGGPAVVGEPPAELDQRIGSQPTTLIIDPQSRVLIHTPHRPMPPRHRSSVADSELSSPPPLGLPTARSGSAATRPGIVDAEVLAAGSGSAR